MKLSRSLILFTLLALLGYFPSLISSAAVNADQEKVQKWHAEKTKAWHSLDIAITNGELLTVRSIVPQRIHINERTLNGRLPLEIARYHLQQKKLTPLEKPLAEVVNYLQELQDDHDMKRLREDFIAFKEEREKEKEEALSGVMHMLKTDKTAFIQLVKLTYDPMLSISQTSKEWEALKKSGLVKLLPNNLHWVNVKVRKVIKARWKMASDNASVEEIGCDASQTAAAK